MHGLYQGDVGLILLDATQILDDRALCLLKERLLLASTFGVKQLVVAINKMDLCHYSNSQYAQTCLALDLILKQLGYCPSKISFVPISATQGDNLVSPSKAMAEWYSGPTLKEVLDNFTLPKRQEEKPFRMPVRCAQRIACVGSVVIGKVQCGHLPQLDRVRIAPFRSEIVFGPDRSFHWEYPPKNCAPGKTMSLSYRALSVYKIRPGDVISSLTDSPATPCASFIAQIIVTDHPTCMRVGYTPFMFCHYAHVSVRISHIFEKQVKHTESHPSSVEADGGFCMRTGETWVVEMTPLRPVVVEPYSDYPALGRFVLRDMRRTVAVGVVREVVPAEYIEETERDIFLRRRDKREDQYDRASCAQNQVLMIGKGAKMK